MLTARRFMPAALSVVFACSFGLAVLVGSTLPARADEGFRAFLAGVWPDAAALGVRRATFDAAFDGVEPDRSLPDLLLPATGAEDAPTQPSGKGQAEFVKPPKRYLRESQLAALDRMGKKLLKKHATKLAEIERKFGVQPEIVLAIWGRETVFGTYRLRHDAITAIATQAYLGRRKDYFRGELLRALQILEEGHVSRAKMKSSWAGAMGLTQFMPSNFYDHAYDFDGDGRKDIWSNAADALASTAKSLADEGWEAGKTWGYEVRKPAQMDCTLEGPTDGRTMREWQALGYTRTFGRAFRDDRLDETAYLLLPEGALGPAFLMLNNFPVIKTYNKADLYALFVGHLADRIAYNSRFETQWATSSQLKTELVVELQTRLNALGYDAGKVDGFIGPATRGAIGAFQKAKTLKLDCFPSRNVLDAVRAASAHVSLGGSGSGG